MKNQALLVFLLVIAAMILIPWVIIWSLNVFGEFLWPKKSIPFNLKTWIATIVLTSFLFGKGSYKKE